jgi:hypothetical protein
MGIINITVQGSFKNPTVRQFSAMHGGHAQAVAEAIEFLSSELLPSAIEQDHALHEKGAKPDIGFGKRKPESASETAAKMRKALDDF